MRVIDNQVQGYYEKHEDLYIRYNDKLYIVSNRKVFCTGDIFGDLRDGHIKIIESERDLIDASFMAPELYFILEKATVQN